MSDATHHRVYLGNPHDESEPNRRVDMYPNGRIVVRQLGQRGRPPIVGVATWDAGSGYWADPPDWPDVRRVDGLERAIEAACWAHYGDGQ